MFEVHKLNEQGFKHAEWMSRAFQNLVDQLESVYGPEPTREKAIVRTKLEEACFFAKRALAMRHENQAP